MDLGAKAARTIKRYDMFASGDRVAVAVSGGADSVCLLLLLEELAPEWDLQLSVVHVNHHLRGAESDADAQFVQGLADERGMSFSICDLDLRGAGNLEQEARSGRMWCFRGLIDWGLAERVALGHTRNDQAETVLFRLLRGSGGAGLAAIHPVTGEGLVRPLLDLDRAEVEAYLRGRGQIWREDASNASGEFARNRIRHRLLPQLAAEWNPAIVETLAQTAELALGEEAYWRTEVDRLARTHLEYRDGAVLAHAGELSRLPLAAGRRLVRRAIEIAKGDLRGVNFGHVTNVLDLAAAERGHGHVHLPGLAVTRSFEWLRFGRRLSTSAYCVNSLIPGATKVPGTGYSIFLEIVENPETTGPPDNVYNSGTGCLDWNLLSGPIVVRNWRAGDQYQPVGKSGVVKIKTLFQEARVPVWERAQWPVLTDGNSIVWARRFGPALALVSCPGSSPILAITELESAAADSASIQVTASTEIL
jgi:tRNA(Ile)-lysidine synthase